MSFTCPFLCTSIATPVSPLNYGKKPPALTTPFPVELSESPFKPDCVISHRT